MAAVALARPASRHPPSRPLGSQGDAPHSGELDTTCPSLVLGENPRSGVGGLRSSAGPKRLLLPLAAPRAAGDPWGPQPVPLGATLPEPCL